MDGLSGTVIKPYKGAKEGGWAGFGKGLGKGVMGLVTGPGAGMSFPRSHIPNINTGYSMACLTQLKLIIFL